MKQRLILFLLFCSSQVFALSSFPYVQISLTGGNAAPVLAVAVNGYAFAAWLNFPNNIQVASFNPDVNFPTGAWTSYGTIAIGSVPQIGIDGVGNAFITWVSTISGSASQILVSRFNVATGTFSTPIQLSNPGTINTSPQIAVSGIGVAVVIWIQSAPFQVLGASYTPMTGLWSAPTAILANSYPASFALDNFNRGLAIQNNFGGPIQGVIQAARLFVP